MPSTVSVRTGQLVDPVLTNLARKQRPTGFIADTVSPRQSVTKETGRYLVFDARDFAATDVDTLKPDRAKTKEVDFSYSEDRFMLEEYALQSTISRREREQADSQLQLETNKLAIVQDQMALAREVRVAALLNTEDAGGGIDNSMDATPSNNWNVAAGTIEADVLAGKEAVYDAIGTEPTHIILPYKVANAVSMQEDIREIIKYTVNGREVLSATSHGLLPPQLFGLTVLVPTTRKYTSPEGATNVSSDVWGDDVRILYVNPSANTEAPTVSLTFQTRGPEVRRWSENDPEVDHILQSEVLTEEVVAPFGAFILKDVLS